MTEGKIKNVENKSIIQEHLEPLMSLYIEDD